MLCTSPHDVDFVSANPVRVHSFFRREGGRNLHKHILLFSWPTLCQLGKKTWPTPRIINVNEALYIWFKRKNCDPPFFGWIKIL